MSRPINLNFNLAAELRPGSIFVEMVNDQFGDPTIIIERRITIKLADDNDLRFFAITRYKKDVWWWMFTSDGRIDVFNTTDINHRYYGIEVQ